MPTADLLASVLADLDALRARVTAAVDGADLYAADLDAVRACLTAALDKRPALLAAEFCCYIADMRAFAVDAHRRADEADAALSALEVLEAGVRAGDEDAIRCACAEVARKRAEDMDKELPF